MDSSHCANKGNSSAHTDGPQQLLEYRQRDGTDGKNPRPAHGCRKALLFP
jgi:hypothetical protein